MIANFVAYVGRPIGYGASDLWGKAALKTRRVDLRLLFDSIALNRLSNWTIFRPNSRLAKSDLKVFSEGLSFALESVLADSRVLVLRLDCHLLDIRISFMRFS